jgi:hypothetical protein
MIGPVDRWCDLAQVYRSEISDRVPMMLPAGHVDHLSVFNAETRV